MKTLDGKSARSLFEKSYGQRVSDATWYRVKKTFDPTFPMSKTNVTWLASIKKQCPQLNFRFTSVVNAVKDSQRFLKNQSEISGDEFLTLLKSQEIEVHANSLTRWFKSINGFNRKRVYKSSELTSVVLIAYAYKLKKENNHPVTSLTLTK